MKKLLFFWITLVLMASCHKSNEIPSDRVVLPVYFDQGSVTPKVYIIIGGVRLPVIFDTGSFGLRILKGALSGASLTSVNQRIMYSYGGGSHGLAMSGEVMNATISFDKLTSQSGIPIMVIDDVQFTVNYKKQKWVQTGNWKELPSSSPAYANFSANLGVGMRADNTPVGNPIPQMPGNGMYIVHFPRTGSTSGGYIIFNPTLEDLFSFKNPQLLDTGHYRLPNGQHSYLDDHLNGILAIGKFPYAVPTLLDTGNPVIWTESPNFPGDSSHNVPVNTSVTMSIGNNPIAATSTFNVKRLGQVQQNYNANKTANSFGAQFFFDFDVLFDTKNGKIEIMPK